MRADLNLSLINELNISKWSCRGEITLELDDILPRSLPK